jgi:hypothetical protein
MTKRDITFHNVTITISANSAPEAYALLCEAFARLDCEYETDTYSDPTDDPTTIECPTSELFPFSTADTIEEEYRNTPQHIDCHCYECDSDFEVSLSPKEEHIRGVPEVCCECWERFHGMKSGLRNFGYKKASADNV